MAWHKFKGALGIKSLALLAIILSSCPCSSAYAKLGLPPKPPIVLPFAVELAGNKIETDVRIVKEQSYSLVLYFMYKENDREDRARIRQLIGRATRNKEGRVIEPGIPIPVRIKISAVESQKERLIVDTELSEHELESWGADSFKKVMTELFLKPGHYRVCIESLKDIPELKGTRINFGIVRTYTGK